MHRNPDWGINEAILSCQNRYKYLIALLKTNPEQLRLGPFAAFTSWTASQRLVRGQNWT